MYGVNRRSGVRRARTDRLPVSERTDAAGRRTSRLGPILLALSVLGCADRATSDATPPTARDSAGVRIVENGPVEPELAVWTLAEEPVFRTGWREGEPEFERPWSAAMLPDGRVAVADGPEIWILSRAGDVVRRLGGAGEGPGEFGLVWSVVSGAGDTLVAHDINLNRVTTFRGDRLLGTERVVPPVQNHRHAVQGVAPDGDLILLPTGSLQFDGEGWVDVALLRHRSPDSPMDTIARLPFYTRGGAYNIFEPMGWSRISGGTVVHVRGDRPEARWYSLEGELLQIARWDPGPRPVTDSVWAALDEQARGIAFYQRMSPAELRERRDRWRANASDALPVYLELLGDTEGNVWMGAWVLYPAPADHYRVIARDGSWIGRVEMPPGFRPLAIGRDRIVGYERDALDVPAVVAYAIEKEGR